MLSKGNKEKKERKERKRKKEKIEEREKDRKERNRAKKEREKKREKIDRKEREKMLLAETLITVFILLLQNIFLDLFKEICRSNIMFLYFSSEFIVGKNLLLYMF